MAGLGVGLAERGARPSAVRPPVGYAAGGKGWCACPEELFPSKRIPPALPSTGTCAGLLFDQVVVLSLEERPESSNWPWVVRAACATCGVTLAWSCGRAVTAELIRLTLERVMREARRGARIGLFADRSFGGTGGFVVRWPR